MISHSIIYPFIKKFTVEYFSLSSKLFPFIISIFNLKSISIYQKNDIIFKTVEMDMRQHMHKGHICLRRCTTLGHG